MKRPTVWIKRSGWREDGRTVLAARTHAVECRFVQKFGDEGYIEVPVDQVPSDTRRCRICGGGNR